MTETISYPNIGHDDLPLASGVGLQVAARAAREFLEALGVSCDGPGTRDSPMRMAQAYQ